MGEFEDIEVEDKLHVIVSVKDFRAIIQHAAITGNDLSARYSVPARPIQLGYSGDGMACEFLLMTVGERGNPGQKTKKGRANGSKLPSQQLEATSKRDSVAPPEHPQLPPEQPAQSRMPPPVSTARTNLNRLPMFDLRPSQRPAPPASMASEGLFVDNDHAWEPVQDEDEEDEENTRLEWDHSNQPVSKLCFQLNRRVTLSLFRILLLCI
jgi:cell cycle checkpoint control protein RAD9A